MEELINTQSDVVGRLAFRYMEMCKVDSSSDSEATPRRSDVSSKGGESSAPEAAEKLFRGHSYQQALDPYDGSSEDSGSSARGSRKSRLGVFRVKGAGRRLTFNPACALRGRSELRADVQMRSSSDSELDSPDPGPWRADLSDSGFCSRSSLTPGAQSPSPHTTFSKRKYFPPSDEGMQRKRQCVSDMELENAPL